MAKVPSPKNSTAKKPAAAGDLKRENEELRGRVRELEETIEAIQSGEVDAIVVGKGDARQVYTLEGSDHPYRVLVENIREGALTVSRSGLILYTNTRFAEMAELPAEKVVGTSLLDFVCPEHKGEMEEALREIANRSCRSRLRIRQGRKGSLPVLISMNLVDHGDGAKVSVVVTDRRKDEDRIMLQARMLDAVGDAVIAADTQNKIIYWNDAATKTYGWERDEALGRDLIDVATPDISKEEARAITARLAKGETWTGEYIVKHRDGHEFPIYASDAPIFDDDGKLIAIIGASHDISEQKQAERVLALKNQDLNVLNADLLAIHEKLRQTNDELTRSNALLLSTEEELLDANRQLTAQQLAVTVERDRVKNLLDIAGVMILALDRNLNVTLINRRGCEILGRTEEEILGKNWVSVFIPEGTRARTGKGLQDFIAAGGAGDFKSNENPVIMRDGGLRDILWSNVIIRDGKGRAIGILRSGEDITERKLAETALVESEGRFRSVLDNSSDMIYRRDLHTGRFGYISPSSTEVVGYSPRELQDMDSGAASAMIHPDDVPVMNAALARLEETGRATAEYRQRAKDGEYRWISNHMTLIRDGSGRPRYQDGTIRDITLRKIAEEALRENEKSMKESLAEKEVLLSEVHHRVKNNLSAFISLLSLDGASEDTDAGRALKQDLQNRARSMALVHDTLHRTGNFSRVNMDMYLTTLVDQVAASYAGKRTIRIIVDAKGVVLDLSRATTAGLIVNELITNSFKYAFPPSFDCTAMRCEPPTIRVTVSQRDKSYLLSIADNGIGLPDGFNPLVSKSLGLKLVNFLARYQLHAEPSVIKDKGTEFNFPIVRNEADP